MIERVSDEKNDRRVGRKLEPLIAGAVAEQNSADAEAARRDSKTRARDEQQRMTQASSGTDRAISQIAVPIPAIDAQP